MFARSSIRVAQPLKRQARTYATESSSSSSSRTPLWIALAMVPVAYISYNYFSTAAPKQATVADGNKTPRADAPKTFTGGDQGFISLKLKEILPYNSNTARFKFEYPSDEHVSGLPVASALLTRFQPEDAEKPVMRPYTPISDEDQPGFVELLIKKYPNGPMTTHIHSLTPGQNLDFKGPLPKYKWEPNKHTHIVAIAGGTGITPMYQLIRTIFKNPDDKTKVTLVFGNLSEEDILLREEFADLENTYPRRFKAFYTVDNPPKDWQFGKGVITKDLLKTVMPEPKEENIKVFVCGPPGLYKAISGPKEGPKQGELKGVLKELGYVEDQVYKF